MVEPGRRHSGQLHASWNPLSWVRLERGSPNMGDHIAAALVFLLLACVPFAVWMAVGQPPKWLVDPVLAILWLFGGFFALMAGTPILIILLGAPLTAIWRAIRPKTADDVEFEEEFNWRFEAMQKNERRGQDRLPWESETDPPKEQGIVPHLLAGLLKAFANPPLPLLAGGLILIIALFASGQPWLAVAFLASWFSLRWVQS